MDPITLEVIRHRLTSIAEEMGAALVRTAYSTNIKDRRDCSCALFTASGDLIAQAEHVPLHLGVLPWAVKGALRYIDLGDLSPGDVVMHNDPYIGGTHVPDIIVFAPIFHQGQLVAFAGNLAHHIDVGGKVIGSLPPDASEIFHEGLRFPPVKIRKRGQLDQELLAVHSWNVRTPVESQGDLLAQLAANNVGEKRYIELCEEFGADTVLEAIRELAEYCDRRMAAELGNMPSGTFEFTDMLEGDGIIDVPISIKASICIKNGHMKVDFSGTGPQTRGPLNAVRPMTLACVYYVVKAVTDPSLPLNHGTFQRIEVITPEGSIVNARFPAPTGHGNAITCQRIVDVLVGALAPALPDRTCAAATGAMNGVQVGGFDSGRNAYYAYGETYGGGYGAACDQDGTSGVQTHMTNTRNTPVEVLETSLPIRVERYGLVPDSEGPGLYRGGFGITRVFSVLADEMTCVISSDRVHTPPWGMVGGGCARGARFYLESGRERRQLPSKTCVTLHRGDRLIIETSGGGGWGDPWKRDPKAVAKDVLEGLVSAERARNEYKVALDAQGNVDLMQTSSLRSQNTVG